MKKETKWKIICGISLSIIILLSFMRLTLFNREINYYKELGYTLEPKKYNEVTVLALKDHTILEKKVSRLELREFAQRGLDEMGHKIVYYDKTTGTIFIARYTTCTELFNLRISGKFLVYRWTLL